jgi:hypothetical protein
MELEIMLLTAIMRKGAFPFGAATAAALALVVACSSDDGAADTGRTPDAGAPDVAAETQSPADAGEDTAPSGTCASTFGAALTEGFGRLDGIVYAVQKPSDLGCVMPDKNHLILQVLMEGAVYRMVVNLESDVGGADTKLRFASFPHALPPPEFVEGWRTGIPLDYAGVLGAHSGDGGFTALTLDEAVLRIVAEVKVGDPVSVYGFTAAGQGASADRVHRDDSGKNEDGAIVVGPTSASPKFLLFHFAAQTF